MMWTSHSLVIVFLSLSGALLISLTVLGPPPPPSRDIFYEPAPRKPRFILGDKAYASFDDAADTLWDGILPKTRGSVLATNLTDGFHFWGQVSMFHQLRCLADIRSQFSRMLRSAEESRSFVANKSSGSRYEELGYCFDYILQGVLCHADTTINPVARLNEEDRIIDGNALWHQCGDSSILEQWADLSGLPHKDKLLREGPHVSH